MIICVLRRKFRCRIAHSSPFYIWVFTFLCSIFNSVIYSYSRWALATSGLHFAPSIYYQFTEARITFLPMNDELSSTGFIKQKYRERNSMRNVTHLLPVAIQMYIIYNILCQCRIRSMTNDTVQKFLDGYIYYNWFIYHFCRSDNLVPYRSTILTYFYDK